MILWCLGLLGLTVSGWGVLSTYRTLHPEVRLFTPPQPFPSLRTVPLVSHDGHPFDVWVLDAHDPSGVVVACHGYHANRLQLIGLADGLRQRGYTVMACELRGHGMRSHEACTFGVNEVRDLNVVLAWLKRQPRLASQPVGLYGLSLGGAIACQAAARDSAYRAVVVDSAYARLFPILARAISTRYRLPIIPWAWITWVGVQVALGRRLSRLDPIIVARRSRAPLLLIHGGQDHTVPLTHAHALYASWHGPKERWIEPLAVHVGTYAANPQDYCNRVAHFFDQWLAPHRSSPHLPASQRLAQDNAHGPTT